MNLNFTVFKSGFVNETMFLTPGDGLYAQLRLYADKNNEIDLAKTLSHCPPTRKTPGRPGHDIIQIGCHGNLVSTSSSNQYSAY